METLIEMYPYYWMRAVSGIIYVAGVALFIGNLVLTARGGKAEDLSARAAGA
jgi:cytochrome c oxidase cbb3-type subunit 1